MKISITGDIGSGKSTVAHILAQRFGITQLSTGKIQREIADNRGMSTLDLNMLSEKEQSVDKRIDAYTMSLRDSKESFVFDSRMAWFFIPESIKILLIASPRIAAERIRGDSSRRNTEEYSSQDSAIQCIKKRSESERKRFCKLYDVDITDLTNYDYVIDTSFSDLETIIELLIELISKDESSFIKYWLSPKSLFPTQDIRSLGRNNNEPTICIGPLMNGHNRDTIPVRFLYYDRQFFILDGHHRISRAITSGCMLYPAKLAGKSSGEVLQGLSVGTFVRNECSLSRIYDWEECHKFRFLEYPAVFRKYDNSEEINNKDK